MVGGGVGGVGGGRGQYCWTGGALLVDSHLSFSPFALTSVGDGIHALACFWVVGSPEFEDMQRYDLEAHSWPHHLWLIGRGDNCGEARGRWALGETSECT